MKKLIIPAFIMLMGAGTAFATKATTSKQAIVDGYRIDAVSGECLKENQCSTVPGETCFWSEDGETPLHELSATMCGTELFKVN